MRIPLPISPWFLLAAGCLLSAATSLTAAPAELRKDALAVTAPLPDRMPGAELDTPALIKLGKQLYFEKKLSANNSQSCNSCHAVDQRRGGVDNEPTSPGAFGKRGGRNSPTTLNAGFHFAQFWDGRAADLQAQAKGPILNPIEMAMPDEKTVVTKLGAIASYRRAFKQAFPGEAEPLTYENLAKAIAAFERTLITRDRFDDYLKGNDRALSELEQQGLSEFLTVGCTTCHTGPLLGGNSYRRLGAVNPYPNSQDKGRIEVTKEEEDLLLFKVPSLRNIALTAPYFHDGGQKTLEETVRTMGWIQLGQKLTDAQANSLVAFLNALTDKSRAPRR
jgi:cytochrome c peroxidase